MKSVFFHLYGKRGAAELRTTKHVARFLAIVCAFFAKVELSAAQDQAIYLDDRQTIEARLNDLLPRLTLEEKVSLVHANSVFTVAGIPRLGIPKLWMDDGPMGVRQDVIEGFRNANKTDDSSTALPATLAFAATFDVDLARSYGTVIGEEAKLRHKNIMLGPGLNIQRTPLCGRNFEYLGEDQFLTSRMAVNYIQGEQSQGTASCAKHFAANKHETNRKHHQCENGRTDTPRNLSTGVSDFGEEGSVLYAMGNLIHGPFVGS